jgi:hypothetical protein
VAITAEEFIHLLRIWLKWELCNSRSALRALPVAFVHLALESLTAIVIESHFFNVYFLFVPFRLGPKNGFDAIAGPS